MPNHPALAALQAAAKGLLFMSETEAPLEAFLWQHEGTLTPARVLALTGSARRVPVEETTLDSLLRGVPREDRAKFDKLAKVLQTHLTDLQVYKVGAEAEKRVYIAGKATDGSWAGLMTTVVET